MNTGLSISNSRLKVVSVAGSKVQKWGSQALPAGLVRDGLILDPAAVGSAIAGLFKANGIPRERVTAGIAGLSFTYRFLSLPRMKPSLLEEAVTRAAPERRGLTQTSAPVENDQSPPPVSPSTA